MGVVDYDALHARLYPTARQWPDTLATPVGFAVSHSRGQFHRYRHVELIERAVLDAIDRGGRLIISVSVRHSKSQTVSRFLPAWYLGRHPDRRVILAGHEADFARTWGRAARDLLVEYGDEFGVRVSPKSEAAGRWDLASPHTGGMLTIGVGGSPIGRGADLMIIDDPIKSYEAAMSPLVRRRVREWWAGTMVSRIEPGGAVIIVMARWYEDDLAGYLLSTTEHGEWAELRLPALCDDPDGDPLGRQLGEPLWPERWPAEELESRRRAVTLEFGEQIWLAQYQQTPRPLEGGMFPEDRWQFVDRDTIAGTPGTWVRGWDLAATADGGDWTVGVLVGQLVDGRFVVADARRGQWSADQVRSEIRRAAADDPPGTHVQIPQDPGQAGKDQAQQLIRMLAGHSAAAEPVTGSKETRATGMSAQQRARNVWLVDAEWNGRYVAELAGFPRGAHDDQVDASTEAFNVLADVAGFDGGVYDASDLFGDEFDRVSISTI